MLVEGATAPDFSIGEWSLSATLRKGPVLLVFFKISCPTCQFALPFLQRLAGALQMVAVSQDDAAGTRQFQRRFQVTVPTILDPAPGYLASNLYGIRNVPSLFLIEPDGDISMAVAGFSKTHLEMLGERCRVTVFEPAEVIPPFRPG